jgi:Meckel syndrome type 1 protein
MSAVEAATRTPAKAAAAAAAAPHAAEPLRPPPPPPHLSQPDAAPALQAASSAPHARAEAETQRWQPQRGPPPSAPPLALSKRERDSAPAAAAGEEALARASVTSACPPGRQSTYQLDAFAPRSSVAHLPPPPSAPPLPSPPPLLRVSHVALAPEAVLAAESPELAALRAAAARLEARAQALFMLRASPPAARPAC